ncbi:MAG TPA: zinc ribbon domain-containing protein [bacterium]|nr:zinc ribbon domain-containing protein [bacterium]
MYCISCGTKLPSKIANCPHCHADIPPAYPEQKNRPLLSWLVRPAPFSVILSVFVLLCGLLGWKIWSATHLPDPARTLENFYSALADHDKDTALSYIHPDKQSLGLGFNIELLLQPNVTIEYTDLKFAVLEQYDTSALVRVTGKAKVVYEGRTREILFNDTANLTALDRIWYIEYSSLGDLFSL